MLNIPIMRSLLLACCILGASCSRAPERPTWTVTIEQSGHSVSEAFAMPANGADFDRQMMDLLQHHMQLSPTGESPRIGIHRVWEDDVSENTKRRLNPTGDKRASVTASTKYSIGPFYATTRSDGRLQLYQLDTPDKPEILVDGARSMNDIWNSTVFYFRERLVVDYPELANPNPVQTEKKGEQASSGELGRERG